LFGFLFAKNAVSAIKSRSVLRIKALKKTMMTPRKNDYRVVQMIKPLLIRPRFKAKKRKKRRLIPGN
jgi:hypothetical protein